MALRTGPVGLVYEASLVPTGLGEAFGLSSDLCRDLPVECISYAVVLAAFSVGRHSTVN